MRIPGRLHFMVKPPTDARKRDLLLLMVAVFCLSAALGVQMSVYYNWAFETLHISPRQLGLVESFRETPGLAMILVAGLTASVAEPVLAGVALLLFSIGLALYSRVHGIPSLICVSLVWSAGLHTWMPLSNSFALRLSEAGRHGRRLGQVGSAGSLGMLFGMGLVRTLAGRVPYSFWWIAAGVFALAGAVTVCRISKGQTGQKPRFVLKRKYSLYYGLTLLEGCRKQIFITFAVYVLVKEFSVPLKVTAGLMLLNNGLNFVIAPYAGRMVDRFGERKALLTSYTALIGVFMGYAFFRNVHWLYVMYCLDNLLFLTSVANSTYLKRIAEPRDVTPSLATGVTMNHMAAVVVPLVGGLLWEKIGYQPVFLGGAAVVLGSIFLANRIRPAKTHPAEGDLADGDFSAVGDRTY